MVINLKLNLKRYVLSALLTLLLGLAYFGLACAQFGPNRQGKWLAGDFHHHTTLTDGSHSMGEDFAHASSSAWTGGPIRSTAALFRGTVIINISTP